MMDEIDLKLRELLRSPDRSEDGLFAERVQRRLAAEERLAEARSAAWQRFALEAAASAAILAAFIFLTRIGRGSSSTFVSLFSPTMLGLLILALWVAVAGRPGATTR